MDKIVFLYSLRCQSLIHLKLYTMRRFEVRECQKTILDYMSQKGMSDVPNGNTPNNSVGSPTNSIGSQVRLSFVQIASTTSSQFSFTFFFYAGQTELRCEYSTVPDRAAQVAYRFSASRSILHLFG